MDEHRFSRLFPPELEHRILALLGRLDLMRAALVCRRFRDMSVSLLFRHIAYWHVYFDNDGNTVETIGQSYKAIFRVLDDVTLGRHVRFLDINVSSLYTVPGRATPLTPDELQTVWSSMTGLVALSIFGSVSDGQDLGLQNVDFPHLQRLGLHQPELCIEFLQRHLHRLLYLSLPNGIKAPFDWDPSCVALVHYDGPYPLLAQLLHANTHTHSLESCGLSDDEILALPPTLAPLAGQKNLRYLSIELAGVDRATILEMIRDCPPFTGVKSLRINFSGRDMDEIVTTSTEPPWSRLMRPFPAALYVFSTVDMEYDVVSERGLAWAQEISEMCKDAVIIVFSPFGFRRHGAGPALNWVADEEAEQAIDMSLHPPVVGPVPC